MKEVWMRMELQPSSVNLAFWVLNLRLREHLDNKLYQMTQTDDIRIWDNDSDLQSLLKKQIKKD